MKIDAFAGIQNTVGVRDLADNGLQDAVNVDIDQAGAVVARKGYEFSKAVSIDAGYTTNMGETYIISGGKLSRIDEGLNVKPLCNSVATEFCDHSTFLFTNDGYQVQQETVTNLSTVAASAPLTVIAAGSDPEGFYSVLVTYTNADGLEGGTSSIATVELTTPGEVLVAPLHVVGHTPNVYMTGCNEDVFYNVTTGAPLLPVQIGAVGFPDSVECIEYHESRLYCAKQLGDNSIIQYSKPLHFHLFDQEQDYFMVPGRVLYMRSAGTGLIIGTATEIYAYQDGAISLLASYGVVPGRSMIVIPDGRVLIHTVQGMCLALPFEVVTENTVSLPMGKICTAALMNDGGLQKYVGLHDGQGEAFNASY